MLSNSVVDCSTGQEKWKHNIIVDIKAQNTHTKYF